MTVEHPPAPRAAGSVRKCERTGIPNLDWSDEERVASPRRCSCWRSASARSARSPLGAGRAAGHVASGVRHAAAWLTAPVRRERPHQADRPRLDCAGGASAPCAGGPGSAADRPCGPSALTSGGELPRGTPAGSGARQDRAAAPRGRQCATRPGGCARRRGPRAGARAGTRLGTRRAAGRRTIRGGGSLWAARAGCSRTRRGTYAEPLRR